MGKKTVANIRVRDVNFENSQYKKVNQDSIFVKTFNWIKSKLLN